MKVSVDVYTASVEEATKTFAEAINLGAEDVRLSQVTEPDCFNLMMEVDHTNEVLAIIDEGGWVRDYSDV